MKPSIRLLKVLTAATWKGTGDPAARPTADDPQAETVTRWRVLPWDIDVFGHMNNSRYLLLMDFASVHYLRRAGLLSAALKKRWIMPVAAVNVDFRRSLKPFERFEIATQTLSWDDRWLFVRHTFRTCQSPVQTVATGYVKTIVRSRSGDVAPAQLARIVCGRDVAPPVLDDDLWVRFNIDPRTMPQAPRHNGRAVADIDVRVSPLI